MERFFNIVFLIGMALMACLRTVGATAAPVQQPSDEELRAVWVATIGGIDWPRTYATSPQTIERQKRELTVMLDSLHLIGINTILLQTRVRATTIYPSALEPWDGCMSGKPGTSPGYDPLAFAVEECHKRGMKLQAWVVTIPIGKWNALGCTKLRQKFPKAVVKIGTDGYLNPAHPQTADIIADVCAEIASRYDVDGIHLDYIRYPENWKGRLNKAQGRQHITSIVRQIRQRVKAIKPGITLSCSPLGKYSDLTRYSSRGWNSLNTVCQDAQAWLRDGLMDQLYPMLYFRDNNFYPVAIDWAEAADSRYEVRGARYENSNKGHDGNLVPRTSYLVPRKDVAAGLAAYCLDRREGNWPLSEMIRQLNVCRQIGLGQCFFRARFLLDNTKGIYDFLRLFNHEAPVVCSDYRGYDCRGYEGTEVRGYDYRGYEGTEVRGYAGRGYEGTEVRGYEECYEVYDSNLVPSHPRTPAPSNSNLAPSNILLVPLNDDTLTLPPGTDADIVVVESLAGNALVTLHVRNHAIDVSRLPEGVFTLRSLHRKGITHRIGMFRIKRH